MLQAIITRYTNVSSEWLLIGIGEPFKPGTSKNGHLSVSRPDQEIKTFEIPGECKKESQNVPLYNIEAVAGLVPLFEDSLKQTPIGVINIPNLPVVDGAVHITGDSMYPLFKSGDIVLYKRIFDIQNGIFYGEIYLLSLDVDGEEYVTVKYIQKSELPDHVKLVSYNSHHSERDIKISSIRAIAFIKASIRYFSMK